MEFEKAERIHDKVKDLVVELESQKAEYIKNGNMADAEIVMKMIVTTNELFKDIVEVARKRGK